MEYNNPLKVKPQDGETVLIVLGTDYDRSPLVARYSESRNDYSCSNGAYSNNEYHDKDFKHDSNAYRVLAWAEIEEWSDEDDQ